MSQEVYQNGMSQSRRIIVLGSTGFLGPYVVASLLQRDTNARIFCINRTEDGEERTLRALRNMMGDHPYDRLQFAVTDITKPGFGLTHESLATLMMNVHEIIFNAWNPNWSLTLENFRPLLEAIQHTIRLCLSSKVPPRIIFISSICAIGEWPRNHPLQQIIPEEVTMERQNAMRNGYGESKFMAELMLAYACTVSHLPVAVVRVGQIGGPISKGSGSWPVQGWIYVMIKASKTTGYWPSHVQPLDWIPVDTLAEGIAALASSEHDDRHVQVYNMVHPQPAPWSLLLATLRERFGLIVTEVSLPKWLDQLDSNSFKLHSFWRAAGCGREHDMSFEMKNAAKVLPKLSPVTMDDLETWLKGWRLNVGSVDVKAKM